MRTATNPPEFPAPPAAMAAPECAPGRAPDTARVHAALLNLLWLAAYVAIMRLLGFRMARPARRRTPRPAPALVSMAATTAAHPRAPAARRRKHRCMNRDMCFAMLADINRTLAGHAPEPAPVLAPELAPEPAQERAPDPPLERATAIPAAPVKAPVPPSRTPPIRLIGKRVAPGPRSTLYARPAHRPRSTHNRNSVISAPFSARPFRSGIVTNTTAAGRWRSANKQGAPKGALSCQPRR